MRIRRRQTDEGEADWGRRTSRQLELFRSRDYSTLSALSTLYNSFLFPFSQKVVVQLQLAIELDDLICSTTSILCFDLGIKKKSEWDSNNKLKPLALLQHISRPLCTTLSFDLCILYIQPYYNISPSPSLLDRPNNRQSHQTH